MTTIIVLSYTTLTRVATLRYLESAAVEEVEDAASGKTLNIKLN